MATSASGRLAEHPFWAAASGAVLAAHGSRLFAVQPDRYVLVQPAQVWQLSLLTWPYFRFEARGGPRVFAVDAHSLKAAEAGKPGTTLVRHCIHCRMAAAHDACLTRPHPLAVNAVNAGMDRGAAARLQTARGRGQRHW